MPSVDDVTRYICLFHDGARAQSAVSALEKIGISKSEMHVVEGGNSAKGDAGVDSLAKLGVPEGDRGHLQDGLRNGGVLISLSAPESQSAEIERIFHHFNADKIDETELRAAENPLPVAAMTTGAVAATGETVIPVAQEELLVGKREVDRGGVRVLRRTVEEPVSQDVSLHGERVVVGYREVNRPATDAELNAGAQDFELIETAEVPVVQKVARVVEEVHVGKVESDHTETVRDSVRHTEVEVEQMDGTQDRLPATRDDKF